MKKLLSIVFLLGAMLSGAARAQSEILSNAEIIEMTQTGLGKDLIVQKVKTTGGAYDVTAKALIELKKGGVADEVIAQMIEKAKTQTEMSATPAEKKPIATKNLTPADILRSARTLAIYKDSLNPSRQALEKELLKRPEWKKLNLSITEDKTDADLGIDIGFVPLSIVTHRYAYRIYDRRSGIVIAAGETTSWGSLAKNLAREISKKLDTVSK